MTDWAKLKVADLKEECKSRDIPLTGLKLKQQYIDKLEEYEAQNANQSVEAEGEQETEDVEEQPVPQANGNDAASHVIDPTANDTQNDEAREDVSGKEHPASGGDQAGADIPSAAQAEDSQAKALSKPEEQAPPEVATQPDEEAKRDEPEKLADTTGEIKQVPGAPVQSDDAGSGAGEPAKDEAKTIDQSVTEKTPTLLATPPATENLSDSNTTNSSQLNSKDVAEDERKRRKRSATPVPSTQDVARKRARLTEDTQESRAEDVPDQAEAGIGERKDAPGEAMDGEPAEVVVETSGDGELPTKPLSEQQGTTASEPRVHDERASASPPRSTTSAEDRDVPPAIHPATSSIYIRNFKRPLHIPSLRAHIVSIAKSRSSDDTDPITTFYLDSIRTHAFVTFTSVAAASRVRSAMHGSRFPDEPLREPLFVDYVPPSKVQTWIDQETGSGFGRGGNGRRFEIAYEEDESGIEAVFQEIDTSKPRPTPFDQSRGSRAPFDRQQSDSISAGVHPDRETLIPRTNQSRDRQRGPLGGSQNAASNNGTGFKALDELFESTSTKPKLYYKPVPSSVADERLDMFRALRPGWEEMGRSGDEGMKRYSFERDKDREEWVDKGPEFGFGRKGQARLDGKCLVRFRGWYTGLLADETDTNHGLFL
ncbi:hypothetical protein AYO21_01258 [Fonsecaea monophora]|uniref:SAP domain-containing protein n=1 Tax=Fonsecaea monophora TaxID=254056 RepID=A0A177FLQ9_9EURO|nr:hypothetical protein AYO21_01258 [Fonsecaea monophora]OAG44262.1 hypothetical protein AYO21_01258 [Fonsecaea monophora]